MIDALNAVLGKMGYRVVAITVACRGRGHREKTGQAAGVWERASAESLGGALTDRFKRRIRRALVAVPSGLSRPQKGEGGARVCLCNLIEESTEILPGDPWKRQKG